MDAVGIQKSCHLGRLVYHFAWRPMRGKPLLVGPAAERLRILLLEKAASLGVAVLRMEIHADCIYLAVEAPPTIAPHSIVCGLKAHSSGALRREYRELTMVPTLWTRDYLVAAGENIACEALLEVLAERVPRCRPRGRPQSCRRTPDGTTE